MRKFMKTHPFFASKFLIFPIKVIGFLVLWICFHKVLSLVNPIEKLSPNEFFRVCIIENNKPQLFLLSEIDSTQQLCQTNMTTDKEVNYVQYTSFKKVDNDWELTNYSDSMLDPWVYRYHIENNKITPLWYTNNGNMHNSINTLISFISSLFFYKTLKKFISRKNKKPSHELNQ